MQLRHPKVYNPSYRPEKKKFSRVYIYLLIILILLGGLFYILFYSTIFEIKNIILENSNNPEINQFFQKLKGKNIFLFSASKIESEMVQIFPDVEGVKIIRGLPNNLKIQFQERTAKVIWQTQGTSYLVLGSGKISQEMKDPVDLPIIKDNNNVAISDGQQVVSENFLAFITELNATFNQATGFKINHFEINETLFQVDAITDQNWKVIFDTTRPVSDQLNDLTKFLSEHQNEVTVYIDVRIEGRVYYK